MDPSSLAHGHHPSQERGLWQEVPSKPSGAPSPGQSLRPFRKLESSHSVLPLFQALSGAGLQLQLPTIHTRPSWALGPLSPLVPLPWFLPPLMPSPPFDALPAPPPPSQLRLVYFTGLSHLGIAELPTVTPSCKPGGTGDTSAGGSARAPHCREGRKRTLPEGVEGVGSPDVCAQHVQGAVLAAILEETEQRPGIICLARTWETSGQKASPRPEPGRAAEVPCPPWLATLVGVPAGAPGRTRPCWQLQASAWARTLVSTVFSGGLQQAREGPVPLLPPAQGA